MPKDNQLKQQKTSKNKVFSLNQAQKSAAEAALGPLLIVAGAGTGKTRTLTSRILYLIEHGMAPERICAITFTNKAAKEMARRVTVDGPLIGTFHSLGARILRKECRALGREPNFVIFDDHDSLDILKKILKGVPGLEKGSAKSRKYTPAFFAQRISELKNLNNAKELFRGGEEEKALIESVFEKYEVVLGRNNAFDFDDLIQKPVALWNTHSEILEKYRTKFDAILVDEYQDINPKQYEFVKLLASGHRNLSVVGDDEQTIYSWRYADIKTFLNFDKDWSGAKVFFLEENYRSTETIIRAAAAVAENNKFRTPKKLWTGNPKGEPITLFEAWGENDEAAWIADEIQKVSEKTSRAEIAILYRTNAQSRAIEQALIRREIPYQIFGGLKFYERREVKDAVAALRWASNDRDEPAKERLEKNLSKKKFGLFKNRFAGLASAKPIDIIKLFLETFEYFDYLEGNFTNADEREENIAELINFASEFENLPELLERISLLQATDDTQNIGAEKVNLMTIHLAKGLEFDVVFIAGAAEGLLPHIRSIDNEASIEEERRLMYVAMTRAKKKLYISFFGMPSRFLAEIPEDCLAALTTNVKADEDESDFEENVVEF
jgi:DNA helicase-2/ATP-dependent DNA helicase PcrA